MRTADRRIVPNLHKQGYAHEPIYLSSILFCTIAKKNIAKYVQNLVPFSVIRGTNSLDSKTTGKRCDKQSSAYSFIV